MNQEQKQMFSTRLKQQLNLPDIDILNTLDTIASKLTVTHHSLSHSMPNIEDELLQGLDTTGLIEDREHHREGGAA